MNKRIMNVEISINGIKTIRLEDATQGDKNTHFFDLVFTNDIELEGYELQVYYLPPFPATVPLVDTFSDPQKSMQIVIPPNALKRNGEVTVEFALSKNNELITINRNLTFEVVKTTNGTSVTAYPEGHLKETIAQQIERIKTLLADTDNKINEYNQNATEKIEQYNNNSTEKLKNFNNNHELKLKSYNDNSTKKLDEFNSNVKIKTEAYDDNHNKKLAAYNENVENQVSSFDIYVGDIKIDISNYVKLAIKPSIDNYFETVIKLNIDDYVNDTSKPSIDDYILVVSKPDIDKYITDTTKPSIDNYVNDTSKPSINTHVDTVAKKEIDRYISEKESEIKGATFTPVLDEAGNLNFKNDKNLPNPESVNIKGPQGDPGNFIFKVENGHLKYYTVENGKPPEFLLRNKNLIMIIK